MPTTHPANHNIWEVPHRKNTDETVSSV